MFKKNDKVKLVRPINKLQKIGEIFRISNIIEHIIVIISEETGEIAEISDIGINKYFEKVAEPADSKSLNGISYEDVDKLINKSEKNVIHSVDRNTVVELKLPNGYVIRESYFCQAPRDYDKNYSENICLRRIKKRLYDMLSYQVYEQNFVADKISRNMEDVIKSASLKKSKKEITDDFICEVYNEIMQDMFKFKIYSQEFLDNKIKEISYRENVDYEELHNRTTDLLIYETHKMLFDCLFRLY